MKQIVIAILLCTLAVCQSPTGSPVAALPQAAVDFTYNLNATTLANPCNGLGTNSPCTWTMASLPNSLPDNGNSFQTVLTLYNPGDIIVLTAGSTYIATTTVAKTCNQGNQFGITAHFVAYGKPQPNPLVPTWTYIVSSTLVNNPSALPQNSRVGAGTNPALLATLSTNDDTAVYCSTIGANYIRMVGIHITTQSTKKPGVGPWANGITPTLTYSAPPRVSGRREVTVTPTGGQTLSYTQSFQIDTPYPRFDYWIQVGACPASLPINYTTSWAADGTQHTICFIGQNTHWAHGTNPKPTITIGAQGVFGQAAEVTNGTITVVDDTHMSMPITNTYTNGTIPVFSDGTVFKPHQINFIHITTPLPAGKGECQVSACTEEAYTEDPLIMTGTSQLTVPAISTVCQINTGPGTPNPCNNTVLYGPTQPVLRILGNTTNTNFNQTNFLGSGATNGACPNVATSTPCSLPAIAGNEFKQFSSPACNGGQECDIQPAVETFPNYNGSPMGVVTGQSSPVQVGYDEVDILPNAVWTLPSTSNGCHLFYVNPKHALPGTSNLDVVIAQEEPFTGAGICTKWTASNLPKTAINFNLSAGATVVGGSWTYPTGGGVTVNSAVVNDPTFCTAYATGYCVHVNISIDPLADQGSTGWILDRSFINGSIGDAVNCPVVYNAATLTLSQTHNSLCWTNVSGTFCGQQITVNDSVNGAFFTCHAQAIDNAVVADGGYFGMIDSTISDIYSDTFQEAHGLDYAFNPGPMTLANSAFINIIGEQIFSGGTSGHTTQSFVNSHDIIYGDSEGTTGFVPHGNQGEAYAGVYMFRDLTYVPIMCNTGAFNFGSVNSNFWTADCKNELEFKNGQRAMTGGMWLENQLNGAQASIYTLTPRTAGDASNLKAPSTSHVFSTDQGTVANSVSDIIYLNNFASFYSNGYGFIAQDYGVSPMFVCSNTTGCRSGAGMQGGLEWPGFSRRINIINDLGAAMDPGNYYNRVTTSTNYWFSFTVNSQDMLYQHVTNTMDQKYLNPKGISQNKSLQWSNAIPGCKDPQTNPGTVTSTNAWIIDSFFLPYTASNGCTTSSDQGIKIMFYANPILPAECNVGAKDSRLIRISGNVYYGINGTITSCAPNPSLTSTTALAFDQTIPLVNQTCGTTGGCFYQLATTPPSQDWRANTHDGYQAGVNMVRLNANIASDFSGTGGPYITTTPQAIPAATQSTFYTVQLYAVLGAVGQYTWNLGTGSMCAGLSLHSNGVIDGTPTTVQTCKFTVTVTDVNSVTSAAMAEAITVNGSSGTTLAITTTSPIPTGEIGGAYSFTFALQGGTGPFTWSETGTLPAGLSLSAAGVLSGTPTGSPNSYTFNVTVTDSLSHTAGPQPFTITINPQLLITTTTLPQGDVGTAYNFTMQTNSGGVPPYSWTSSGLPADNLVLDTNGNITGTPNSATTINSTYTVTDSAFNPVSVSTASLALVINGTLSITTLTLPDGTINTAYSQQIKATGGTGPWTWSSTGLPCDNLNLGASTTQTVTLSGTPGNTAQSCTFTATVTDSLSVVASQQYTVNIHGIVNPLVITSPNNITNPIQGIQYSYPLQATGGSGIYTWSIKSGALPNGLTLSAQGVVSGVPAPRTIPYHAAFVAQVSDTFNTTPATKNIFFTVNPPSGVGVTASGVTIKPKTKVQ